MSQYEPKFDLKINIGHYDQSDTNRVIIAGRECVVK